MFLILKKNTCTYVKVFTFSYNNWFNWW